MTTSTITAHSATYRNGYAWADGARIACSFRAIPGDIYGNKSSVEAEWEGEPKMIYRDEWDDAHPGVEPTRDAMLAALDDGHDDLVEAAREELA
jgi:hypothetical protein